MQVLVFCLYKKEAQRVEQLLLSKNYNVAAIHGDLTQVRRWRARTDAPFPNQSEHRLACRSPFHPSHRPPF
jgi:superfamily II DNA helicase RecQ